MLDTQAIIPGFEDPYYYLWREAKLPLNEDPFHSDLKDPLERKRLARVLDRGLERATGYVLPMRWLEDDAEWETRPWPLRRERLYLILSDSPMGFRLPLESLPSAPLRDLVLERDPFAPYPPLPRPLFRSRQEEHARTPAGTPLENGRAKPTNAAGAFSRDHVRTALCIEPREGRLHVFIPPLKAAEAYLYLTAALEETARELKLPLIVEGPGGPTPSESPFLCRPDLLQSLLTYWQHHPSFLISSPACSWGLLARRRG